MLGTAALVACRSDRTGGGASGLRIPGEQGGPHITVEVLNASGKPGLAKVATRVLRRAGIDVVAFGNAPESVGTLDSTRIAVRRGTHDVGERVRKPLGVGRVSVQPDTTRLLDASVFLGADFAPRLEFHP
jgi:LytR cell envelope-related transcriptional attenuator